MFRDRHGMMGIVDYASKYDMKYALRKLDDTEFKVRTYMMNFPNLCISYEAISFRFVSASVSAATLCGHATGR